MSTSSGSKLIITVAVAFIIGLLAGYSVGVFTTPSGTIVKESTGLQGEVNIGVILPLTGGIATYGENSEVAAELAEMEINQWLKNIGANWTLKLVTEDTAADPTTALNKVQTLNAMGIRFIVGPITSPVLS